MRAFQFYYTSQKQQFIALASLLPLLAQLAEAPPPPALATLLPNIPGRAPAGVQSVSGGERGVNKSIEIKLASRLENANKEQQQQSLFLSGSCAPKASCKQRERRPEPNAVAYKLSCHCDDKCVQYDDCCSDSNWSQNLKQRASLGLEQVRFAREQWRCTKLNPMLGDILIKTSCSAEWLNRQVDKRTASLVRRRCEYVKDRGKRQRFGQTTMSANTNSSTKATATHQESSDENDTKQEQHDPLGMMMPITDLASGITYANSYCLRCSGLELRRAKLIYWSPKLECKYNIENDDRNTLHDLISTNQGQVLQYSIAKNSWTIDTNLTSASNGTGTSAAQANAGSGNGATYEIGSQERTCKITPTIPESVEHMVRNCVFNTIDSCPRQPVTVLIDNKNNDTREAATATSANVTHASQANNNGTSNQAREQLKRAQYECQFGHQALVYSKTSESAYYNMGCALCNGEQELLCEQKSRVKVQIEKSQKSFANQGQRSKPVGVLSFSPPGEPFEDEFSSGEITTESSSDEGLGSRSNTGQVKPAISGSFSVLMDLYGSSQGDEQVGAIHQCPDADNQVYDPFFLTCRDIICGLNHHYVEGTCVAANQDGEHFKSDLVEKFKPAMAYITSACLIVSITSLSLYLLLYCLSMFDLRHWAADVEHDAILEAANNSTSQTTKRLRERPTRASRESTGTHHSAIQAANSGSGRSQSLSSRGVACLASSLLAAYLLFLLGHQRGGGGSGEQQTAQEMANSAPLSCVVIAVGTYYCFLVAFNWMFLLSYDIWRTLRLATCQLRAPATNSQSVRFLGYSLFALLAAALFTGVAVLVDLVPLSCNISGNHMQPSIQTTAYLSSSNSMAMAEDRLPMSSRLPELDSNSNNCNQTSDFILQLNLFVHSYRPKFGQREGSCWFSNRRALALFFGLPVTLIMLINLLFFLHSSFMVVRTSSRSSRHLSNTAPTLSSGQKQATHRLTPVVSRTDSSLSSSSATNNDTQSNYNQDFAQQNSLTTSSLISVQTLQSQLSVSDESSGDDSPTPPDGDRSVAKNSSPTHKQLQQTPPLRVTGEHGKWRFETSKSSSSLTNQSIGANSIANSLALKYDAHLQSLSSVMGSLIKDYRLYCRLSTIMGLTWLTGLVASLVDQSDILWYLFVVLNTLQGLFIFIAFGCKRSKLANLQILLNYMHLKWRLMRANEHKAAALEQQQQQ